MSELRETLEAALQVAADQGADVVQGEPHVLLLDLDTPEQEAQWTRMRDVLRDRFGIACVQSWPSKSGHRHVAVHLGPCVELDAAQRVALQCACGSDPMRALLSIAQMGSGAIDEPNLLFRPFCAPITLHEGGGPHALRVIPNVPTSEQQAKEDARFALSLGSDDLPF